MNYCPNCGEKKDQTGNFCSNCGKPYVEKEIAATSKAKQEKLNEFLLEVNKARRRSYKIGLIFALTLLGGTLLFAATMTLLGKLGIVDW